MPSTLIARIKETAYLTGHFITRSGKPTTYYIDKYRFETQPDILEQVAIHICAKLPPADSYDRLGAPELGAVAIAAAVALKARKPFVIVRKASKDYGTAKQIEGDIRPGEKIVLIEDVLTTGGAALKACETLKSNGAEVILTIGVINRQEGAEAAFQAENIPLKWLITRDELQADA